MRGADKGFHDLQSSHDENWGPGKGFQETTYLIDSLFQGKCISKYDNLRFDSKALV